MNICPGLRLGALLLFYQAKHAIIAMRVMASFLCIILNLTHSGCHHHLLWVFFVERVMAS